MCRAELSSEFCVHLHTAATSNNYTCIKTKRAVMKDFLLKEGGVILKCTVNTQAYT